ncbi:hypothetical protein ILYODFUR_037326 [Ilyodon furcidens]|uniref:Uncharacterized protein n=1 Tax=Ilyodon furcidens TaxID=33524 RepID=A0ABV0VK95_9TELE
MNPLDGHVLERLEMLFLLSEVQHHLLGLGGVQLQMVGPALPHKVLNQAFVLPLLSILDTATITVLSEYSWMGVVGSLRWLWAWWRHWRGVEHGGDVKRAIKGYGNWNIKPVKKQL